MEEGISNKALKSLEDTECGWGGRGGLCPELMWPQMKHMLYPASTQGQKDPLSGLYCSGRGGGINKLWTPTVI